MDKIVLFKPYIPTNARVAAFETLGTRWIGQGPKVDQFEEMFEDKISSPHRAVAVNSGTSALHLSYILADIGFGDEVVTPVFSCSATHTPLLYQGAKIKFADIKKDSLNIDPDSVRKQMNERVKAIVCVDYSGIPCDMNELKEIADEWGVPLIEDAAQAIGASYEDQKIGSIADFTAFSFQAIKTITTTDGGMVTIKNSDLVEKAKRIRWFGIDRKAKFEDRWKKDITEVGYKYQMTDVNASIGIESMKELESILRVFESNIKHYRQRLNNVPGIRIITDLNPWKKSSNWLCTVIVENREGLKRKLTENLIESDPVHYRCDNYSVFGGRVDHCPNMDEIESKYLVLPMHYHITHEDIDRVCDVIQGGW